MQDLVQVDTLNIAGILLWVSNMIWFPATAYEVVTWIIGVCVGVSLVSLNVIKIHHMIKDKNIKDNDS